MNVERGNVGRTGLREAASKRADEHETPVETKSDGRGGIRYGSRFGKVIRYHPWKRSGKKIETVVRTMENEGGDVTGRKKWIRGWGERGKSKVGGRIQATE